MTTVELPSDEKRLLSEIADAEKLYNGIMHKRMLLYEQLKELDAEEASVRDLLTKKKDELRNLVSSGPATPTRTPRGIVRTVSLTFKNENPTPNIQPNEEAKANSLTEYPSPNTSQASLPWVAKTPNSNDFHPNHGRPSPTAKKTAPKYLDNIDIQMYKTGNVWEVLYQTRASSEFLHLIPQLKIKSISTSLFSKSKTSMFNETLARLSGPFTQEPKHSSLVDPPDDTYRNLICAKSISTYPPIPTNDRRDGDPVCDRYNIEVFPHCVIAAIADGCNWGTRPRNAAIKATEGFVQYFKSNPFKDLKEIGRHLFKAVATAHNNIIHGLDDVWEAGTTTLLGGILMEVEQKKDKKQTSNNNKNVVVENYPNWAFVLVSIGDCKAFRWSCKTRKVVDITEGNRNPLADPTDPGGRIGPYLEDGIPDLRNVDLYFEMCEEGDLILLLTDGVHDNLDPQFLGKIPKEFKINANTWKEAEALYPEEAEVAKSSYRTKMIEDIIDRLDQKHKDFLPLELSKYLLSHVEITTKNGREFLQNNFNKRIPDNLQEYPGKMDHSTVCCIRVGKLA